jgi:hypothetical protein
MKLFSWHVTCIFYFSFRFHFEKQILIFFSLKLLCKFVISIYVQHKKRSNSPMQVMASNISNANPTTTHIATTTQISGNNQYNSASNGNAPPINTQNRDVDPTFSLGFPNLKKKRRKVMDLVDRSKNLKLSFDDLVNYSYTRDPSMISTVHNNINNLSSSNNQPTVTNVNISLNQLPLPQPPPQTSISKQQIMAMFGQANSSIGEGQPTSSSPTGGNFQGNYQEMSRRLEMQHPNGRYRLKPIQYKFDYRRNYTSTNFENIFNASESILIGKIDHPNRNERIRREKLAAMAGSSTASGLSHQPETSSSNINTNSIIKRSESINKPSVPSITTLLKNSNSFNISTKQENASIAPPRRTIATISENKVTTQNHHHHHHPHHQNNGQSSNNFLNGNQNHNANDLSDLNMTDSMFDESVMYTRVDSPMKLGKSAADYETCTYSTMNFNQRYNSQFEMFQSTKASYGDKNEGATST